MSPATTNLTILELKYKLQRCEILCHIDFSDHTKIQFNQIRPLVASWMTNFIKKNFAVQIPFLPKIKRKKKKLSTNHLEINSFEKMNNWIKLRFKKNWKRNKAEKWLKIIINHIQDCFQSLPQNSFGIYRTIRMRCEPLAKWHCYWWRARQNLI